MVELTKLNGEKIYLNENWIEAIESLPDTTITLSSGNKFVVLESMEKVLERFHEWRLRMDAPGRPKNRRR